ncbi:TIGR02391 family protein [Pseudarthrobacter cellobiosi]|uniref:TIGR02391 family protein n=1 Tax=Pseudarthrobacter cellobiosi TaxID=2953654 RepID=UPI0035ABFC46
MGSAVSEAFKSLEVRVRKLSGLDQSGASLMTTAFAAKSPILDVATEDGRSAQDEREGFMALFRGAMIGIRNPKAHELFREEDPQQALEYLAFASLLHRRIDLSGSSN